MLQCLCQVAATGQTVGIDRSARRSRMEGLMSLYQARFDQAVMQFSIAARADAGMPLASAPAVMPDTLALAHCPPEVLEQVAQATAQLNTALNTGSVIALPVGDRKRPRTQVKSTQSTSALVSNAVPKRQRRSTTAAAQCALLPTGAARNVDGENLDQLLQQLSEAVEMPLSAVAAVAGPEFGTDTAGSTTRKVTRTSVLSGVDSFIWRYAHGVNRLEGTDMQEPPLTVAEHLGGNPGATLTSTSYTLADGHVVRAVPLHAQDPPFTQVHDDILREVMAVSPHLPWDDITALVVERFKRAGLSLPGTSSRVIKRRALALQNSNRRGGVWTEAEDAQLRWVLNRMVAETRPTSLGGEGSTRHDRHVQWADAAFRLMWRTGKQCRDRWYNILDPDIRRGPFTDAELETMLAAYQRLGKRWTDISKLMPGRSESMVKNWFMARERAKRREAQRAARSRG